MFGYATLAPTLIRAVFSLLVSVPFAVSAERFENPTVDGQPMDNCLSFAASCGKTAAEYFCREEGQEALYDYLITAAVPQTVTLVSRQTCAYPDYCQAFSHVECGPAVPSTFKSFIPGDAPIVDDPADMTLSFMQYAYVFFAADTSDAVRENVLRELTTSFQFSVAAYFPPGTAILDVGARTLAELDAHVNAIRNFDSSIVEASRVYLPTFELFPPEKTLIELDAETFEEDVLRQMGLGYVKQIGLDEAFADLRKLPADTLSEPIVAVMDSMFDINNIKMQGKFLAGYDFAQNDMDVSIDRGASGAMRRHGTVVSSIITSAGNTTGVNPNAKIYPMKLGGPLSFFSFDPYEPLRHKIDFLPAIQKSMNDKLLEKAGVRIINYSAGLWTSNGAGYASQTHQLVQELGQKGILLITAAGNDNVAAADPAGKAHVPSGLSIIPGPELSNLISVSSYNEGCDCGHNGAGNCWVTQNYRPGVDLVAPEYNLAILPPEDPWGERPSPGEPRFLNDVQGGERREGGSSYAAPIVSGVASLLLTVDPTLSAAEMRFILLHSADTQQMNNKVTMDAGIDEYRCVNAGKAVKEVIKRKRISGLWAFSASGSYRYCDVQNPGGFRTYTSNRNFEMRLDQKENSITGAQSISNDLLGCCTPTGKEAESVEGQWVDDTTVDLTFKVTNESDTVGCQCKGTDGCAVSIPATTPGSSETLSFALAETGELVLSGKVTYENGARKVSKDNCVTRDPNGDCIHSLFKYTKR